MRKRDKIWILCLSLILVVLLLGIAIILMMQNRTAYQEKEDNWSIESLKKGRITAIEHNKLYSACIRDKSAAEEELVLFGEEQREKYDNPKVSAIEKWMQEEYRIFAVNLGEMDEDTAKDVERAFAYMYERYPELYGKLTNVTLANPDGFSSGHLAITEMKEYIINGEYAVCPFVVKHQILLSASAFLKREELLKKCEENVLSGYWPKDADISAIVVHELGHQLLNAYAMQVFEFEDIYYITDQNDAQYAAYLTDFTKMNQTVPKEITKQAFERWREEYPEEDYEAFCASISGYAMGIQKDGGISYTETVAEAITDVYLHGDAAAPASKMIEETLTQKLRRGK